MPAYPPSPFTLPPLSDPATVSPPRISFATFRFRPTKKFSPTFAAIFTILLIDRPTVSAAIALPSPAQESSPDSRHSVV